MGEKIFSITMYTYDKNNRLLTETKSGYVKSYTYDANGNMLTGDGATYTYDARGRQSGYVKGTTSASYTYYPTGMRKTKNANLATTNYVWDGSNMVLEYTNSAVSGKVYIYGFTLISQGNSLYYIYNAHGDVVKYMNSAGTVLKSYEYDAFGEEVNASTTDANPFRYAGQYFDAETGTYYLRARYYSPVLGRFTQQDAWGYGDPSDPLSLNLYVYCYGNPVAYVDYTGNSPVFNLRLYSKLYNLNRISPQYMSYMLIGENGLNVGQAMHEIAQVNVAKYLLSLGFQTTLEKRAGIYEVDIVLNIFAWEVKPWGKSGIKQLNKYCKVGEYINGFDIEPIRDIPIIDEYKMAVVSSEEEKGVLNYYFYKYDDGEEKKVSSLEVYSAIMFKKAAITVGAAAAVMVVGGLISLGVGAGLSAGVGAGAMGAINELLT